MATEEQLYIKEILETKFDAFTEILKSELGHLKDEVKKIEANLEAHVCQDDEETAEMRASIVRIHGRIDGLEERLKNAEQPKKLKFWERVGTKVLDWAVPFVMLAILWLLSSGTLGAFVTYFLHAPK